MDPIKFEAAILPIDQIEEDPSQPRQLPHKNSAQWEPLLRALLTSIKSIGICQPLSVRRKGEGRYELLDGHRRYHCAKILGIQTVPCMVFAEASAGVHALLRFEIQNNRRDWKPLERANALAFIKSTLSLGSNKQLAEYVHLSSSTVDASLKLREQMINHLAYMEKGDISETYRTEFVRLFPKMRRIRDLEVRHQIEIIVDKIVANIIKGAKELRVISWAFIRAATNEDALYEFFSNPAMTVRELEQSTSRTMLSLYAEKFMEELANRSKNNHPLSEEEKGFLVSVRDALIDALPTGPNIAAA